MHIARRFEALLDKHRHPDGRKWTGAELAEATGGLVHRSYVTNLRKGRIESPGYDKLKAVAKAMGFPPELWFSDYPLSEPEAYESGDHDTIAERLELFQTSGQESHTPTRQSLGRALVRSRMKMLRRSGAASFLTLLWTTFSL
jgi:transcriptional regulator with XRE-family HTH domain